MNTGEILTKTGEELLLTTDGQNVRIIQNGLLFLFISTSQSFVRSIIQMKNPFSGVNECSLLVFRVDLFSKIQVVENSAGSLIEKVGLKGYRHGGAYFSEKHANFLMSDGTAKWTDLVELVELAQKKVHEECQISLEPEVRIVHI
jgi:hypothetical protein